MSMVTKTSVYLEEDQKRALTELAKRTGVSEAELLRRGVRLVIEAAERPRPRVGLGASRDGGRAADADADLARLVFGS